MRFAAIVESWLWQNVGEDKHTELRLELERPVDFRWIRYNPETGKMELPPVAWQQNESGESLLSRHRQKVEMVAGE